MARLVGSTDFGGLVEACATVRGIPAADIEKDIWVVEALRSVFRPIDRATIVFKGGTSLSKAYGIIERFSEDVDLLVVPDADLGRKACERILKELPVRAAADMGPRRHERERPRLASIAPREWPMRHCIRIRDA